MFLFCKISLVWRCLGAKCCRLDGVHGAVLPSGRADGEPHGTERSILWRTNPILPMGQGSQYVVARIGPTNEMRTRFPPRLRGAYCIDPKPYSLSYGYTLNPILIQTIARRKQRAVLGLNMSFEQCTNKFRTVHKQISNSAQKNFEQCIKRFRTAHKNILNSARTNFIISNLQRTSPGQD